eukprot:SAG11_NODE_1647_length_4512_cov_6.823929_6_plen_50_part_00
MYKMPASAQLLKAAVAFAAATATSAAPAPPLERMLLANFVHERSVHNPV